MLILLSSYLEAHTMIRNITGFGEGNGPFIAIHDGFDIGGWDNFLPGSDRIALDTHPYFAFQNSPATDPIATGTGANAGGIWPAKACNSWGGGVNNRYIYLFRSLFPGLYLTQGFFVQSG
jgi:glucan 1,3-beta-glucosidase